MANVEIIVDAVVDGALSGLRSVEDAMSGLQPAAKAIQNVSKAAFAVLAAGAAAAGAALVDVVSEAMKAEEVTARFDSIVASSHLADYADEMKNLAQAMSETTRFDDEAILGAEAQLALYENIGQDIFPEVIATSLDLAEALKTDATGGAEALGRALSDIAEGSLSLLYRNKLITKEQQNMAEEMAKTGDAAKAQAFILDILEGKIGTLAEELAQTTQGKWANFLKTVGNLKEALGNELLPLFDPLIDRLTAIVNVYGPQLVAWFQEEIVPAVQSAVSAVQDFISILTGGKEFNVDEWVKNLDFAKFWETINTALENTDWNKVGAAIGEGLKTAFEIASKFLSGNDWPSFWQNVFGSDGFIVGIGEGISSAFGGAGDWDQMWADLESQFQASLDAHGPIMLAVKFLAAAGTGSEAGAAFGIENQEAIQKWAVTMKLQIDNAIRSIRIKLLQSAPSLSLAAGGVAVAMFTEMRKKFKEAFEKFKEVGKNVLDGIKAGIEEDWATFVTWLTTKINQIVDSVMNALGIHSPSRVFANIGRMMMAGMAEGIGQGVVMPIQTMQTAMPQVLAPAMAAAEATQNHYYYGARIMLERGNEGQILASLTV